jgi:hypothetical protein
MFSYGGWVRAALLCWGLVLTHPGAVASAAEAPPEFIYGVTVNDVSDVPALVGSLKALGQRPTTRVVFDSPEPATQYLEPVRQIKMVSEVMGEIVDSSSVGSISVDTYLSRTLEYLTVLGDSVTIWEIGNEVNGEWLGDTPAVVAKISGAYELVTAAGKPSALTLYYNDGCYERPANEMFTWAAANVPDRLRQGLAYVFISYYEDDCEGLQPDWSTVFPRLAAMFPNSKVGFGEVGTKNEDRKAEYIQRYYGTRIAHPAFVGGVFWWYFREDCVPVSKPLWKVLNDALQP